MIGRHISRRFRAYPACFSTITSNLKKRRVAIVIGFLGTKYLGMQFNSNVQPTIEGELEMALFKSGSISLANHQNPNKIGWRRSSRTDKEVHAARMVVSAKLLVNPDIFESDSLMDEYISLVNSNLPPDIRIFSCLRVNRTFDARRTGHWRSCYLSTPPSET